MAEIWFKEKSWMWMKPSCHVSTRNGDFPDVTGGVKFNPGGLCTAMRGKLFSVHQSIRGYS